MYVYYIGSPKGCKSFRKVLSFYTHTILHRYGLINRCQPVPVRFSGPKLVAPHLESALGRTAIVVVRTPYISSYVSVLPYRWDFALENRTRDMLPVFWSPHQGAGPFLLNLQFYVGSEPPGARKRRKNSLVLAGIRTRAAWLAVSHTVHHAPSE